MGVFVYPLWFLFSLCIHQIKYGRMSDVADEMHWDAGEICRMSSDDSCRIWGLFGQIALHRVSL